MCVIIWNPHRVCIYLLCLISVYISMINSVFLQYIKLFLVIYVLYSVLWIKRDLGILRSQLFFNLNSRDITTNSRILYPRLPVQHMDTFRCPQDNLRKSEPDWENLLWYFYFYMADNFHISFVRHQKGYGKMNSTYKFVNSRNHKYFHIIAFQVSWKILSVHHFFNKYCHIYLFDYFGDPASWTKCWVD